MMRAITDFDVNDGLDALTRHYAGEEAGRAPAARPVSASQKELADAVFALRTIMKSVKRWSSRGGKHGYLAFVKNCLPQH